MLNVTRGQVVKFRYRKPGQNVSSAQYKGRVFDIIPNPVYACYDIMVETSNGLIRRFHARGVGQCKRVGMVERLIDWLHGTSYQRPMV